MMASKKSRLSNEATGNKIQTIYISFFKVQRTKILHIKLKMDKCEFTIFEISKFILFKNFEYFIFI